ncbi:ORF025L [Rock bream iridovirus]|uniref:ORF025L n=1 Tax=Rock bream iridovirus TaxID=263891 RepID=Q5YF62_ISKNV|nr:ORF025L [Rock bream iridovirus]
MFIQNTGDRTKDESYSKSYTPLGTGQKIEHIPIHLYKPAKDVKLYVYSKH